MLHAETEIWRRCQPIARYGLSARVCLNPRVFIFSVSVTGFLFFSLTLSLSLSMSLCLSPSFYLSLSLSMSPCLSLTLYLCLSLSSSLSLSLYFPLLCLICIHSARNPQVYMSNVHKMCERKKQHFFKTNMFSLFGAGRLEGIQTGDFPSLARPSRFVLAQILRLSWFWEDLPIFSEIFLICSCPFALPEDLQGKLPKGSGTIRTFPRKKANPPV